MSPRSTKETNFKEPHGQLMEMEAVGSVGGVSQLPSAPNGQARIRHRPEEDKEYGKGTALSLLLSMIDDHTSR